MVERATDPLGGRPTSEAWWLASRGDRLLRDMLVKYGFKAAPPEGPHGYCYVTNAIREANHAGRWRGSLAERHASASETWDPVLRWESEQSPPMLVAALGNSVLRILATMEDLGLRLPHIEGIPHYAYIAHRPQGSLRVMHPDRVRAYDEEFERMAALLQLGEDPLARGS